VQVLHRLQLRRKLSIRALILCVGPLVLLTQSAWPGDGSMRIAVEGLGLALIALCVLGRAWCALYIGGKKAQVLVDRGPYSVSRNPLYLFSCLGALGVGLRTGSWLLGALAFIAAVLVLLPVIQVEELVLLRTFGPAFADYCARVPRIGPRLSLWRDAELLSVAPRHLYRVVGDSLIFASTIPMIELVAWAQAQAILPVLLRLL
jgi:protein-S-isoprenylcysteine O-methyltransferase Ste14